MVASPNSPSGTAVPTDVLASLADAISGVLVVDEAYADFADDTALPLARERDNVIVLRTFSKSFSLAGMRIALGFAHPKIIEGLNKVKDSYNLDRLSIAAGTRRARRHRVDGAERGADPEDPGSALRGPSVRGVRALTRRGATSSSRGAPAAARPAPPTRR